jgi:hypothetical protein
MKAASRSRPVLDPEVDGCLSRCIRGDDTHRLLDVVQRRTRGRYAAPPKT